MLQGQYLFPAHKMVMTCNIIVCVTYLVPCIRSRVVDWLHRGSLGCEQPMMG